MPVSTPAMATTQKFDVGRLVNPVALKRNAKENPRQAPTRSEGAKFPPLPPALKVNETANTFTIATSRINNPNAQSDLGRNLFNGLPVKSCAGSKIAKALMEEYPSPN